jgi:hypothetical protein
MALKGGKKSASKGFFDPEKRGIKKTSIPAKDCRKKKKQVTDLNDFIFIDHQWSIGGT